MIDPNVLANIVSQAVVSSLEQIINPNVVGQGQEQNTEQVNTVVQNTLLIIKGLRRMR